MDRTGLDALQSLPPKLERRRSRRILWDLKSQPRSYFNRAGFVDIPGVDNVCGNLAEALIPAHQIRPQAGKAGHV